jgi:hypothetical protein
MATLIVGKARTRIPCHKILLGFFSEFFESALYGDFSESRTSEVFLPDDELGEVQDFVAWPYSGRVVWFCGASEFPWVSLDNRPKQLRDQITEKDKDYKVHADSAMARAAWVFGDKIIAPRYSNNAMKQLLYLNEEEELSAAQAEWIFQNSIANSKLRVLVKDSIACCGPFNPENQSCYDDTIDNRRLLLAKGGDLVMECVEFGLSQNLPEEKAPWYSKNQTKVYARREGNHIGGVVQGEGDLCISRGMRGSSCDIFEISILLHPFTCS